MTAFEIIKVKLNEFLQQQLPFPQRSILSTNTRIFRRTAVGMNWSKILPRLIIADAEAFGSLLGCQHQFPHQERVVLPGHFGKAGATS